MTGRRRLLLSCAALSLALAVHTATAAEWRAEIMPTAGRVSAVETAGADVRVAVGGRWYRFDANATRLDSAAPPEQPSVPKGALPDARVAIGTEIARAWLDEPTTRYAHAVLGDAVEAGRLVIERREGKRAALRLGPDAVFEDIVPRIARLDGVERIVLVKSYLDRGSALAIVDPVSARIIGETPPIGRPNAWLNPAGIADFDGDGATDIALVRQPHVVGRLELWSWRGGTLAKTAEVADASNHVIGSRALGMSVTADFNHDGRTDLAVPTLDRRALRLITFTPAPSELARVPLPARVATNIGVLRSGERTALVFGLENGALAVVNRSVRPDR
jgi:hypothetical protein